MNSNLKTLLTLIVAFALGYVVYPLINNANQQGVNYKSDTRITENPQMSDSSVIESSADNNEEQPNNAPMLTVKESHPEDKNDEQDQDVNEESMTRGQVEVTENVIQQNELKRWVIEHKQEIGHLVETHFPNDIVDSFQKQIDKNNTVFNEPELKQDEQKDENWAYIMEQDIRAIYEQQNSINGVELIKVTCKQLTCDMLGTAKEVGVWFKAYSALYTLPNVLFPENSPKPVHLSFPKEDVTYSYSQIFFAEQG